jgi:hypothetical protein
VTFHNVTFKGRAQSLPLWFPAACHTLRGRRESSLIADGWPLRDGGVVPSGYMELEFAGANEATFFAQAPGADSEPSTGGPVLVMLQAKEPRRPHRWLQRLWLVVFVLFCLEVGIVLTVLPWTRLWTENSLLLGFPAVKVFMNHNFVRGLVSGLGLVDIWMGVVEAVTYRENSRN